jgi:transposase
MLNLTYNYKLQPTTKQIETIEHNLNVCKSVWNHALYIRKLWYNSRSCKINQCSLFHEYIVEPFEEKVEGLSKRIDNQEFVSRGVLIGLIIAIAGGAAKLFGFADKF